MTEPTDLDELELNYDGAMASGFSGPELEAVQQACEGKCFDAIPTLIAELRELRAWKEAREARDRAHAEEDYVLGRGEQGSRY